MVLFTAKYAPKNSFQVFGQQKVVGELRNFITNYKQQKQKAALVFGAVGCGKTSSIYALAQELNYDVLEINSSDLRNEENINTFLGAALGQQSLFFRPKIVLIDEIDNLSGRIDRGCLPALLKAISNSSFPVIITANDPFDVKLKHVMKIAKRIEFHKLQYRSIAHALQWVCEQEKIEWEEKALHNIARQADGDLRGALIDLQICATKGKVGFGETLQLSDRKRTESILNALAVIFKSSTVNNALTALEEVDLEINDLFFWIDENLPREYACQSLARAYEQMSRADVFQGRIVRQQHWRFLVYVTNLLTAGISSAKDERNTTFVSYKPTMRILRMWQAKMKNAKVKEIAEKLAAKTHVSKRRALEQIPYLQLIFRNGQGKEMAAELDFSVEEINWLRNKEKT